MKSKKIDKLRYKDYSGIEACLSIFQFLEMLNIKCSSDAIEEFECVMEEFCSECHIMKEDCDCRGQHDFDHDGRNYDDGDRAYDAWKDAQMEKSIENAD